MSYGQPAAWTGANCFAASLNGRRESSACASGCRRALTLDRGQRRIENRVGSAEFAQQLPSHARAETGRRRQRRIKI